MSHKFIDNLNQFNRKERFYLVGMALGNTDFAISEQFTARLQAAFPDEGINFSHKRFAAMDYHLDWIYASLYLAAEAPAMAKVVSGLRLYPRDKKGKCITATVQDIDFVTAFGDLSNPNLTHFIMLEAKGASGWTNSQLKKKAGRLEAIFGHDGKRWQDIVVPHFAILSPRKPSDRLRVNGFPEFIAHSGQLVWLEMPMPNRLQKVTRCDENGRNSEYGTLWKVDYQ